VKSWKELKSPKKGNSEPEAPSRNWYQSFLRRKSDLKLLVAAPIEAARLDNATDVNIREWFENTILKLQRGPKYDPRMIANCDETMLQMNQNRKFTIIAPRTGGVSRIAKEAEVEHITFVATIFAHGYRAPTLIIYPQKTLPKEICWEDMATDEDFIVTGKPGGWIDKEVFEQYCLNIIIPFFLKQRERLKGDFKRGLFVVDGHSSRWNEKLMKTFKENEIDVVTLVSHTSHICQPLDALVFGLFKNHLHRSLRTAISSLKKDKKIDELQKLYADDEPELVPASEAGDMDVSDTESIATTVVLTDDELSDEQNGNNDSAALTVTERRWLLVEVAKQALHYACYREQIKNSFRVTGIYPPSLETALKREGVRILPTHEQFRTNIAANKKRKRLSINGCILTSEESLKMLTEEENRKSAANQAKAAKIGRKPKLTSSKSYGN
jgi:hypothetical protein